MTRLNVAELARQMQGIFQEQDVLKEIVRMLVQAVLEEEITRYVGAGKYERTKKRRTQRNGTKDRKLKTRVGELNIGVPQARDCGYRPSLWERYQRSEKALLSTIRQMYVQGVSTRKVTRVMEEMGGFEVSSATVSAVNQELDELIERFRNRPLERDYPYVIVDARYEKVRERGRIVSKSFMSVFGVNYEGVREVLDFGIGDVESEATWGEVFKRLRLRGLSGVELITSDDHGGIRNAVARYFHGAAWQRCWVHFVRNMMKRVPRKERRELAADLRPIIRAATRDEARANLETVVRKWEARRPRLAELIEEGAIECLNVFSVCPEHRRRLCSSNVLERAHKELKRRSRVVGIFPDEGSVMRLLGAHLVELHEKWQAQSRAYLDMSDREFFRELEVA